MNTDTILKLLFLLLAVGWTIAIMVVCWIPIDIVVPIQESGGWFFELPDFDKMVHTGIFVIFALLWSLALSRPGRAWKILLAGIALATLTEVVQRHPWIGRQSDFDDACYDVAGVIAGLLVMGALARYFLKRSGRELAQTVA